MAEIDDKVIGVGCIHEIEDGVGRIRFMGVDDDYQKQGIGKAIVKLLEEYANKNMEQGLVICTGNCHGFLS